MSEKQHQKALIKWFNLQYPAYAGLLAAFNNSEYVKDRRKAKMVGAERRRMGVVAGMPDLVLLVPRICFNRFVPVLFVEMKDTAGRLQKNQIEQHELLKTQGHHVVTSYGWDDAKNIIVRYMNESPIT